MLETVCNGHYQIACSKYFIHTHGGIEPKILINHPNQYFEESREIRTNSREKIDNRNKNKSINKNNLSQTTENINAKLEDSKLYEQYLESNIDWDMEVEEGSLPINKEQKNYKNNQLERINE